MDKKRTFIFLIAMLIFIFQNTLFCQNNPSYKNILIHINPSLGLDIPSGGARQDVHNSSYYYGFDVSKTHNPALSFSCGVETPWFKNWFSIDSLWLGLKISTQRFKSKNTSLNDHLWISTYYISLNRYFTINKVKPYTRLSIGASTLNTSQSAFVLSAGGAIDLGVMKQIDGHNIAFEVGYNAPLIAYKNKLTGFICLNFTYQISSFIKIKEKDKFEPSFKY